jgi:Gpi18-like mannosyltransferase
MVYLAFVLAALYYLLQARYGVMMFLVGIAMAIKLQTVFFLPFLLLFYWIEQKMSALTFLWIPVAAVLTNIPAFCAGIGLNELFSAYFIQGGAYPWLYYFYPNLWFFFQAAPYYMFSTGAVLLALTVLLSFTILLIVRKVRMTEANLLPVLIWTAYSAAFFMPHMHERYGFMAEVAAAIWAAQAWSLAS